MLRDDEDEQRVEVEAELVGRELQSDATAGEDKARFKRDPLCDFLPRESDDGAFSRSDDLRLLPMLDNEPLFFNRRFGCTSASACKGALFDFEPNALDRKNCARQACWNLTNFTKSSKSQYPSKSVSKVAITLGSDLSRAGT